jgi:hypothetical protein
MVSRLAREPFFRHHEEEARSPKTEGMGVHTRMHAQANQVIGVPGKLGHSM